MIENLIDVVLLTFLVTIALTIARLRTLFPVAMLTGLFSLLSASLFVLMDAVDVALTEAAVGAGVVTVLFLGTFALTRPREEPVSRRRTGLALAITLATGAALIYATLDMPHYGEADTPVQNHPLREHYLETSREEIGIPNIVTAVLASYRGFDTLGEVTVIFTAGVAVFMLLGAAPSSVGAQLAARIPASGGSRSGGSRNGGSRNGGSRNGGSRSIAALLQARMVQRPRRSRNGGSRSIAALLQARMVQRPRRSRSGGSRSIAALLQGGWRTRRREEEETGEDS